MSNKKGQMVFEFLIAGIVFFAILVFLLNFINNNIYRSRDNFNNNFMNAQTLEISDMLMNPYNKRVSIVSDWGVFDSKKITLFKNTYCSNNDKYRNLVSILGLKRTVSNGAILRENINITLMYTNNTIIFTCGKPYLNYVTTHRIQRVGMLKPNKHSAKEPVIMFINIW